MTKFNQDFKPLSANAEKLLKQRYYSPNENWQGLVTRVVDNICLDEDNTWKSSMKNLIYHRVFMPNSPALVNAGKNSGLMACTVINPLEDTLENHMQTLTRLTNAVKYGFGVGFTGNFIRPKGYQVFGSTHGKAYGPNEYAKLVSKALGMLSQGGFRLAAIMYTLDINHEDAEDFITLKTGNNQSDLYNFNASLMIDNHFMDIAINNPHSRQSRLLNKIAETSWGIGGGDPGILFRDTIWDNSPYSLIPGASINATNPCGEQPLCDVEYQGRKLTGLSCNLGSINLGNDIFYKPNGEFDFTKYQEIIAYGVQFLDNVGTANKFPDDDMELIYGLIRPIGLGISGLADAFLRLGLKYGDNDSLRFLDDIGRTQYESAKLASWQLGMDRGIPELCLEANIHRRNACITTQAPTGSTAFIMDCLGSGCEPIYTAEVKRVDERGETYVTVSPYANESHFVSVLDTPGWLDYKKHIDIQSALQNYLTSACSKTVNLPNNATVEDVKSAYIYAWNKGCKGVTVYRDGSREVQVLTNNKKEVVVKSAPVIKTESHSLIIHPETPISFAFTESDVDRFDCKDKSICPIEKEGKCSHCSTCGWSQCSV
jgi:ribonucleoside-diphosphate reductase alpha chain